MYLNEENFAEMLWVVVFIDSSIWFIFALPKDQTASKE